MNEKNKHTWHTLNGYTKEELVVVEPQYLNDFLRKREISVGRIVAFNKKKNLALVEFRQVTYLDEKANPPVRRYPMKWVGFDHFSRHKGPLTSDDEEQPLNLNDYEQSK